MRKNLLLLLCLGLVPVYSVNAQIYDTVSYPGIPDSITIDWQKLGVADSDVVKSIKQLTTNENDDEVQCWGVNPFSKDATKLIYTARYGGNSSTNQELVMMNMDGTDKVLLTRNNYCNSHGNFMPDGKHIIYQRRVYFESFDEYHARIFLAPLDSMIANPDSAWGIDLIELAGYPYSDTNACYLKPIINNEGTKIAFRKDDGDSINGLFVMNIDGSGLVSVTDTLQEATHHVWSPDGQWLAFQTCDENSSNKSRIYITKADGSISPIQISPMALVDSGWCSSWPNWSPDGKWIAYHSRLQWNQPNALYLYNVEDESTTLLLRSDTSEICAPTSWDPTSEWLVYKAQSANGVDDREISLWNVNTGETIKLTTGYYEYRQWFTPDGNGILIKEQQWGPSRDEGLYGADLLMLTFETDLIRPLVYTKDITVDVGESCSASITANDVDNGSWDNIGIVSKSLDITSFDCDDIGEVVVTLTVEDAAGNSASGTATVTVVQLVGIDDELTQQFRIYPNPANDYLRIDLAGQPSALMTIYDESGRAIIRENIISGENIDISALNTGVYLIQVISNDASEIQKVTIAR